jgi:hypothetical protein
MTTSSDATILSFLNDVQWIKSEFFHDNASTSSPLNDVTVKAVDDISTARPWLPWDNPRNLISHATEQLCYYVIGCGITNVLAYIGIPANLLNMAVFAKQVGCWRTLGYLLTSSIWLSLLNR